MMADTEADNGLSGQKQSPAMINTPRPRTAAINYIFHTTHNSSQCRPIQHPYLPNIWHQINLPWISLSLGSAVCESPQSQGQLGYLRAPACLDDIIIIGEDMCVCIGVSARCLVSGGSTDSYIHSPMLTHSHLASQQTFRYCSHDKSCWEHFNLGDADLLKPRAAFVCHTRSWYKQVEQRFLVGEGDVKNKICDACVHL